MAEHNGTKAILKLRFDIFTLHMNYDMLGYSEEFKRKRETNGGLILKVFTMAQVSQKSCQKLF